MAQATVKKKRSKKQKPSEAKAPLEKQSNDSADEAQAQGEHIATGLREGVLFLLLALATYIFISLATFSKVDPSWSNVVETSTANIANTGGIAGAWLSDILLTFFGYVSYLFPLMIAYLGIWLYQWKQPKQGFDATGFFARVSGCIMSLIAGTSLFSMHFGKDLDALPTSAGGAGGALGEGVSTLLVENVAMLGSTLLCLTMFLTGVTLFTALSWLKVCEAVGRFAINATQWLVAKMKGTAHQWSEQREVQKATKQVEKQKKQIKKIADQRAKEAAPAAPSQLEIKSLANPIKKRKARPKLILGDGLPSLDLLDPPREKVQGYSREALEIMSRQLESILQDFGIEVKVMSVNPGPVITRFEVEPAAGVKVSQISNLSKDLARSLSVVAVRVVEIIPGKSTMGLEIPNENREMVMLREIFQSADYANSNAPLTMALGKDIGGNAQVANIAKMPHLLIAGTTGSGKSVGINVIILSLLYKTTPDEVRMIMIDPKMLELSVYEGIPHLLSPVVTDMKEAANALRWCVAEMERRYQLMSALGVRNLEGCNKKIKDALKKGTPLNDPLFKADETIADQEIPTLEPVPYIVVIIDELADMMMIVGKKVEELIARLAQKARAAGIHLVLATQRPSVDVITGLIKANIPTRIAFQVSSRIDSRTILDQMGAENLLGHGDMLYLPPGSGLPIRVHGAFVDDHEVHKVVDHWKSIGEPDYIEEVLSGGVDAAILNGIPGEAKDDADPLYDDAVRFVTESRKASISGVQRRLKIGYNRAARMVEEMEASGVVGPLQSNGAREVLAPPPPEL